MGPVGVIRFAVVLKKHRFCADTQSAVTFIWIWVAPSTGIDEVPELAAAAAVAGCTSPAAANRTAVHAAASRFIVTKVIPSYSS